MQPKCETKANKPQMQPKYAINANTPKYATNAGRAAGRAKPMPDGGWAEPMPAGGRADSGAREIEHAQSLKNTF